MITELSLRQKSRICMLKKPMCSRKFQFSSFGLNTGLFLCIWDLEGAERRETPVLDKFLGWYFWDFYIFAIITNGKHSKAILRTAPADLPLLFEDSFTITLFADVARHNRTPRRLLLRNYGRAHACSSPPPLTCGTHMSGSSSTSRTCDF
jgi:hypothetical protein